MKHLFTALALFLAFSIVFSACTNSASTQRETNGNTASPTNTEAETKTGDYPPIPAAVAQAEIKSLDGSTFRLEDKKGKVILINLWATWCGPCRAEMPELIAMQNEHGDKNFEIIGLNSDDETPEEIKPFVEDMKLNYTIGWADGKLVRELFNLSQFGGIPQSFLIDREGRLRGVFVGGSKKVVAAMKETVGKVVNES